MDHIVHLLVIEGPLLVDGKLSEELHELFLDVLLCVIVSDPLTELPLTLLRIDIPLLLHFVFLLVFAVIVLVSSQLLNLRIVHKIIQVLLRLSLHFVPPV